MHRFFFYWIFLGFIRIIPTEAKPQCTNCLAQKSPQYSAWRSIDPFYNFAEHAPKEIL